MNKYIEQALYKFYNYKNTSSNSDFLTSNFGASFIEASNEMIALTTKKIDPWFFLRYAEIEVVLKAKAYPLF